MPSDTLLTAIRTHLDLSPTHTCIIEPIGKGASGRTIIRLKPEGYPTYVGIHYTMERKDNASYLPISAFLKEKGFRVPEVIYDNPARHVALVEDLGAEDLLMLKKAPLTTRLPLYQSAMEQLDKLFYTRAPKDLPLQAPFDAALYTWEQEYFFEHFLQKYLHMPLGEIATLASHSALHNMAENLGKLARCLVHRDFQSQNLMIKDHAVWLIDFQGMRMGRQEYDLASLIYDPYMAHTPQERRALIDLWETVSEEEIILPIFEQCAVQRLLQALGAFAKIGQQPHQEWYLSHIPTALQSLRELTSNMPLEEAFAPLFSHLQSHPLAKSLLL